MYKIKGIQIFFFVLMQSLKMIGKPNHRHRGFNHFINLVLNLFSCLCCKNRSSETAFHIRIMFQINGFSIVNCSTEIEWNRFLYTILFYFSCS